MVEEKRLVNELGAKPPLSWVREKELLRQYHTGNAAEQKKALDDLVEHNLRFVIMVAQKYYDINRDRGIDLGDLVGEGTLGLIMGIKHFDTSRNLKLISYAVHWIKQRILTYLVQQESTVRLPLSQIYRKKKLIKEYDNLDYEERQELAELALVSREPLKLDSVIRRDDSGETYLDRMPSATGSPDAPVLAESDRQEVERLLACLDERSRRIIRMHYGLERDYPMTLDAIGACLGLTRERVRQIRNQAMQRIRVAMVYGWGETEGHKQ